MSRKRKGEVVPVTPPSAQRQAAWDAAAESVMALPVRPELAVEASGSAGVVGVKISEGETALLKQAIGSKSGAFVDVVICQLMNLSATGATPSDDDINAALAFVAAVEPRNEVETVLAVQMFGAQRMSYDMMLRAKKATMLPQFQAYGNMGNKWARTFATLTDSLVRLRNGGEQRVRHIHVNEGGQMVYAENMHTGGRDK